MINLKENKNSKPVFKIIFNERNKNKPHFGQAIIKQREKKSGKEKNSNLFLFDERMKSER